MGARSATLLPWRKKWKRPTPSQRDDQTSVIRPQNTMRAWGKPRKPCDASSAVFTTSKKRVTRLSRQSHWFAAVPTGTTRRINSGKRHRQRRLESALPGLGVVLFSARSSTTGCPWHRIPRWSPLPKMRGRPLPAAVSRSGRSAANRCTSRPRARPSVVFECWSRHH